MRLASMVVLLVFYAASASAQYDVLIRGGRILDGTGNSWFYGDVAVQAGHIAAVGRIGGTAKCTIDASERMVAPGFIDIHNHGRRGIFQVPIAENWLRQGVTTILEGNDGSSPVPLGEFLAKVAAQPASINFGSFVGQGTIRSAVMGLVNRPATAEELRRMEELTATAMREGAFGISTGLFYVPGNFTPTDEVVALAKVVARYGGMHISHMRNEAEDSLQSVREVIRIGEEGGLPTQVTHHKIIGARNWGQSEQTLRLVADARARGVDVTVDQYPYTASSTGTAALFPQWSLEGGQKATLERLGAPDSRAKIKAAIVKNILENRGGGDPKNVVLASCSFDAALAGKSLADLAKGRGLAPTPENAADIAMDLQQRGGCSAIYHAISEPDIERIMRSPYTMIASDGEIPVFGEAAPHPRSYGTFARVLGRYVRERNTLSWEEAVRKMSSYPAERLKIADRGFLRAGMRADVVVFNPATVADRSEFSHPHQYAEGFDYVLVNGKLVLDGGKVTKERPGQVLYGPGRVSRE